MIPEAASLREWEAGWAEGNINLDMAAVGLQATQQNYLDGAGIVPQNYPELRQGGQVFVPPH